MIDGRKTIWLKTMLTKYFESLNIDITATPILEKSLSHLIGVSNILESMGTPQYVQDAGLFHSIYGEAASNSPSNRILQREELRTVIGDKAEDLVYMFATIPAPRTENIRNMIESQERTDLLNICIASVIFFRASSIDILLLETNLHKIFVKCFCLIHLSCTGLHLSSCILLSFSSCLFRFCCNYLNSQTNTR